MNTENLTNDWLDLLRDEAKLVKDLDKCIKVNMIGKSYQDEARIRAVIHDFADLVANDNFFDTEFTFDVEEKADITVSYSMKDNTTTLVGCTVKSFFLHEKAM